MPAILSLRHIFIDHSNVWGGARLATKLRDPAIPDIRTRVSIRHLDSIMGGRRKGVTEKVVCGGIPPGMEGVWAEYQKHGYDTQRLFRDNNWKERGVDHTIIGHMWRVLAQHRDHKTTLVLASGDGRRNEFGTSFIEVLQEVLERGRYPEWTVELYSFDWPMPNAQNVNSPTKQRMKALVEKSDQAVFHNLMDDYDKVVYHNPR